MRTRVLRRPVVFLRVLCSILILLIKTVRCSIRLLQHTPLYKQYRTVIFDGTTFSNNGMSRHNGMTSIKINVVCHKARHSHEGPGENTKNLVMYDRKPLRHYKSLFDHSLAYTAVVCIWAIQCVTLSEVKSSRGFVLLCALRFKEKEKRAVVVAKATLRKPGNVQPCKSAGRLEFSVGQWVI
jgi:hypothetical protein